MAKLVRKQKKKLDSTNKKDGKLVQEVLWEKKSMQNKWFQSDANSLSNSQIVYPEKSMP